jgi:hypothetical protein
MESDPRRMSVDYQMGLNAEMAWLLLAAVAICCTIQEKHIGEPSWALSIIA